VCPVQINIPQVLVHLREKVVDSHRGGVPNSLQLSMTGASWALGRGSRLAFLQVFSGLAGRVYSKKGLIGRMPAPLSRWTDARDLPAPPVESFRKWWTRTDGGRRNTGSGPGKGSSKK
jgi:L-lactate dehydrogenase complex protein LldF